MPIWDRTLTNLQKGHDKLVTFAAALSERVKAEITIIRVRMRIDEVGTQIGEQHRIVGRKLLELRGEGALPQSFELFFKNTEVMAALEKIAQCERELENLRDELRSEARAVQTMPPQKDGEDIS